MLKADLFKRKTNSLYRGLASIFSILFGENQKIQKIRKILLRKNGWNVDVPVTSHYRRGSTTGKPRGRPKKKKLTGNSYYSFIGKKGCRPRMYNKLPTT